MSTPLLQVEGLERRYGRAANSRVALRELSFSLVAGEVLGVVGESASGKTTLARIVAGLLPATRGTVLFRGEPVAGLRRGPRRAALQMVFQDPAGSLDPRQRIGAAVEEPLAVHEPRLATTDRRGRVAALLERVGLGTDFSDRYPHELSVGQCQRVALARALVLRPQLLVLDEPISALDASLQVQILALVAQLARDGIACLLISHNLAAVRAVATRVLVLLEGRLLESGPAAAVYEVPRHPYTRLLLDSAPVMAPGRPRAALPPPAGVARSAVSCVYTARCAYAQARCAASEPALVTLGGRAVACHRADELAGERG